MQILLNTAHIKTIKRYLEIYDITGITSNPLVDVAINTFQNDWQRIYGN